MEWVYTIVGIIAVIALSILAFDWSIHNLCEKYHRLRHNHLSHYWAHELGNIENATRTYHPEVAFLAYTLKDCMTREAGIDPWKFRDELEAKFGRKDKP